MWVEFTQGTANPWISKTDEDLLRIICKCDVEQTDSTRFEVLGVRERKATSYAEKKEAVREFACEWSRRFGDFTYSWGELAEWQYFFAWAGRKLRLLREFRENAIC